MNLWLKPQQPPQLLPTSPASGNPSGSPPRSRYPPLLPLLSAFDSFFCLCYHFCSLTAVSSPQLTEICYFWLVPTMSSSSPSPALNSSITAVSRNVQPSLFSSNPPLQACSSHRNSKQRMLAVFLSLPLCVSLAPHLPYFWSFPWPLVTNELKTHLKTHFC